MKSLEEGDSVKDEETARGPARYLEDDEGLEVGSRNISIPLTNVR